MQINSRIVSHDYPRQSNAVFTWRIPQSGTRKVARVAKVSGRYACVSIIVDIFQ